MLCEDRSKRRDRFYQQVYINCEGKNSFEACWNDAFSVIVFVVYLFGKTH